MCPRVLHFRYYTYFCIRVRVASVLVSVFVLHRCQETFSLKFRYGTMTQLSPTYLNCKKNKKLSFIVKKNNIKYNIIYKIKFVSIYILLWMFLSLIRLRFKKFGTYTVNNSKQFHVPTQLPLLNISFKSYSNNKWLDWTW